MSPVFSSPLLRRGGAALAALVAALALTACFESNTIECSSGVVCPEGSVCTADGLGCRQLSNQCGNGHQHGVTGRRLVVKHCDHREWQRH